MANRSRPHILALLRFPKSAKDLVVIEVRSDVSKQWIDVSTSESRGAKRSIRRLDDHHATTQRGSLVFQIGGAAGTYRRAARQTFKNLITFRKKATGNLQR
jgi:hypothetical protein